jgi:hypothetical protein
MKCPICKNDTIPFWQITTHGTNKEYKCRICNGQIVLKRPNSVIYLSRLLAIVWGIISIIVALIFNSWIVFIIGYILGLLGIVIINCLFFQLSEKDYSLETYKDIKKDRPSQFIKLSVISLMVFVIGGIIGGIVGTYKATRHWSDYFYRELELRESYSINQNIDTLEQLHNNDIKKAIEILEINLDRNLSYIYLIAGNDYLDQKVISTLRKAKKYRSRYPCVAKYPETVKAVQEILSRKELDGINK